MKKQLFESLAPFRYEQLPDGTIRINGTVNPRHIALRFEVTVPDNVSEIGDEAFSHCKFITELTLPEKLKKIGNRAFSGCSGLISVSIPEGVEQVGSDIFSDCYDLTTVYCSSLHLEKWATDWVGNTDAKIKTSNK